MGYIYFCNNPRNKCHIGDCVIRAISKALNTTWENVYIDLVAEGFLDGDMPNSNEIWGRYLYSKGFDKKVIPEFSTIRDFCREHPVGTYILGTGTHVVAVIDGHYYDTWDSGEEEPIYYWEERYYR